jgi:hypothetical protein
MLGSNSTLDMRLRTKVRGLSRWGTLCGVLAMLTFVAGCPLLQPGQRCETNADCPDDGNFCSGDPVCQGNGRCGFTGNPCTGATPVCVEETDSCVECVENDDCGSGEACSDNVCVDTCSEDADCTDDGLFCNGDPVCTEGLCDTTGNPCSGDTPVCVEATDECVECVGDGDCGEGEVCTDNVCVPDVECTVDADCNDDNPCTTDTCTEGVCSNDQIACPQGQSCNPATGNCEDIACTSDADCNDGFSCTEDTCNAGTCEYTNIDARCNDGQFCTGTETCDPADPDADAAGCVATGNPCEGATPVCVEAEDDCRACDPEAAENECDDGIACTEDVCEKDGSCTNTPDNAECDDDLFCTLNDVCDPENENADANGCVYTGNPCNCDDGDECDVKGGYKLCSETANDGAGGCEDCEANADCDDGIACTGNACDGLTGVCTNPINEASHTSCDDGLFCTEDDFCSPDNPDADGNGCVNETNPCAPKLCEEGEGDAVCVDCMSNAECQGFDGEDDIDCTESRCNGATGECVNVTVDGNCGAGEVCDAVNGCVPAP